LIFNNKTAYAEASANGNFPLNDGLLIISILGGLGNQMFQYVFYKYLLLNGYNAYVHTQTHITYKLHYFNLSDINFAKKEDIEKLFGKSYLPFKYVIKNENIINIALICCKKIFRKVCNKLKIKLTRKNYWEEWNQKKEFCKTGLNHNTKMYMVGFYQEYSYLKNMRKQLLNDFKFVQKVPVSVKAIIDNINNEQSVSVHVRRGDYVGTKAFDICSINYYKNAIKYIASVKNDLKYYIFSDDIDWVKENFDFIEICQLVDNSAYENSDYWDLLLMSKCKYNIIANSTFSWWGAWLNQNPEKIVVVPEKWNGNDYVLTDEICPPEWKRMAVH
jgi:hypothetical protein